MVYLNLFVLLHLWHLILLCYHRFGHNVGNKIHYRLRMRVIFDMVTFYFVILGGVFRTDTSGFLVLCSCFLMSREEQKTEAG